MISRRRNLYTQELVRLDAGLHGVFVLEAWPGPALVRLSWTRALGQPITLWGARDASRASRDNRVLVARFGLEVLEVFLRRRAEPLPFHDMQLAFVFAMQAVHNEGTLEAHADFVAHSLTGNPW